MNAQRAALTAGTGRVSRRFRRDARARAGDSSADRPSITVRGQTYTPRSILARNMGTEEDQTTAFPPHKIVGTSTTSAHGRSARF